MPTFAHALFDELFLEMMCPDCDQNFNSNRLCKITQGDFKELLRSSLVLVNVTIMKTNKLLVGSGLSSVLTTDKNK